MLLVNPRVRGRPEGPLAPPATASGILETAVGEHGTNQGLGQVQMICF